AAIPNRLSVSRVDCATTSSDPATTRSPPGVLLLCKNPRLKSKSVDLQPPKRRTTRPSAHSPCLRTDMAPALPRSWLDPTRFRPVYSTGGAAGEEQFATVSASG